MSYDEHDNIAEEKNNHLDHVQAIMRPSSLFDVFVQQWDRNPPQNKDPKHFPYKCAVERTLKPE